MSLMETHPKWHSSLTQLSCTQRKRRPRTLKQSPSHSAWPHRWWWTACLCPVHRSAPQMAPAIAVHLVATTYLSSKVVVARPASPAVMRRSPRPSGTGEQQDRSRKTAREEEVEEEAVSACSKRANRLKQKCDT